MSIIYSIHIDSMVNNKLTFTVDHEPVSDINELKARLLYCIKKQLHTFDKYSESKETKMKRLTAFNSYEKQIGEWFTFLDKYIDTESMCDVHQRCPICGNIVNILPQYKLKNIYYTHYTGYTGYADKTKPLSSIKVICSYCDASYYLSNKLFNCIKKEAFNEYDAWIVWNSIVNAYKESGGELMNTQEKIEIAVERVKEFLVKNKHDWKEVEQVMLSFIVAIDEDICNGNFTIKLIDRLIQDMVTEQAYNYEDIGYMPYVKSDAMNRINVIEYIKENLK